MGKKLKIGISGFLVTLSAIFIFLMRKTSNEPVPAGRFEVQLVNSGKTAEEFTEIDITKDEEVNKNIGKKVKTEIIVEEVRNSRSKKAIFISPRSSRVKIVVFTSPTENREHFRRLKGFEKERVVVTGKLISHPRYGVEIIAKGIEPVK